MLNDDPAVLFSGLFIGALGTALMVFGRKRQQLVPVLAGLALAILPLVVTSLAVLWTVACGCVGTVYWAAKHA